MFSSGNFIGYDKNGQHVHQQMNIKGHPQINSQMQLNNNNRMQYQQLMYTPTNAFPQNSSQIYIQTQQPQLQQLPIPTQQTYQNLCSPLSTSISKF